MSLTDGLRWTQKCSDITEIFRERRILELDPDNREAKVLYKQAPFIPLTWGCSMELHGAAWSCMELHGAAWKSSKSWVNRCPYWALTQMRKAGFCLRSLCHMQLCWLMEVCSSMISMHLDADVLAPDL